MRQFKIYLDTSIINFAVDDRNPKEKEVTLKLIEEIKQGRYEVFISDVVIFEIKRADKERAEQLAKVIKDINPEQLVIDDEVRVLASKYMEEGVIPAKYENDAIHIAVASVNNLDLIVSWNFEHIVKFKTKKEVTGINSFMGYKDIEIYSPREVVEDV